MADTTPAAASRGPKKRTGRRLRLHEPTAEGTTIGDTIVACLHDGMYLDDACRIVGVGYSTAQLWLRHGRDARAICAEHDGDTTHLTGNQTDYLAFLDAVESARAQATRVALGTIRAAADNGQWQAAAWYLERTQPAKYGRNRQDADDTPADSEVTPEQLEAARDMLLGLPDGSAN
jgi:hypothetical protein